MSTYIIIKKLESDSTERELAQMISQSSIKVKHFLSLIEKYTSIFNASFSKESLLVGDTLKNSLKKRMNDSKNKSTDSKAFELFNSESKMETSQTAQVVDLKPPLDTTNVLSDIQSRIDSLKASRHVNRIKVEHDEEEMVCESSDSVINQTSLCDVIEISTNQSLELALNKRLNNVDPDQSINLLAESILKYEFENRDAVISSQKSTLVKQKRCVINILLDYFCHFDPQIVNHNFEIEFKLLFELKSFGDMKLKLNSITHSFLLSLFIHQASWTRLYACIQHLLENHTFFSIHSDIYTLNPIIILDFLASMIHIPELWKGTELKILQKYNEENVLDLDDKQICCLVDFVIEEMFLLHDSRKDSEPTIDDNRLLIDLNINLNRRVQLLKHFFNNKKIKKDLLFKKIIAHLQMYQRKELCKILSTNQPSTNLIIKKLSIRNDKVNVENLLQKFQNIFLYSVYLEENSIIYHLPNANRLFSTFYFQIDLPTQMDLRAHNLLNCFGEIEVNLSNNLTSSGIIGVASGGTKKTEKQEIIVYAKKQESFMMDANLVCVKLAASHVFIFLRQLPMMEGLLQGRVAYTFDEFKRRKFDKLFHYVLDLLNILVPFVFHPKYADHVDLIISHYFDVFMVSSKTLNIMKLIQLFTILTYSFCEAFLQ